MEKNMAYPERIEYGTLTQMPGTRNRFINTRKGWYTSELNINVERMLFETELDITEEDIAHDILNLQYFFIRLGLYRRKSKAQTPVDYILLIHVSNQEDRFRVDTYLSMQAKYYSNLYIYTVDKPVSETKDETICQRVVSGDYYLRVLPLLRIGEDGIAYSVVENSTRGLSAKSVQAIYTLIASRFEKEAAEQKKKAEERKKTHAKGWEDTTDEVGTTKFGGEADGISIQDEISFAEISLEEDGSGMSQQERDFLKICGGVLRKLLFELKGTRAKRWGPGDKAKAVRVLGAYLENRFDHINLMTQLLWMYSLYALITEKRMLLAKDAETTLEELVLPELENSFSYAKSFSEGILQIVENSCVHTDAHSCFMSLRLHYVDRAASDSDLLEVANTRSRLIKRFTAGGEQIPNSRMELMDGVRYYLEVNVIDDASYLAPGAEWPRLRGITEVFLDNNRGTPIQIKNRESITLWDVFQYYPVFNHEIAEKEDNQDVVNTVLDQITFHYGLHLIEKVVTTNRGICVVRTPYRDRTTDDKGNDSNECYALFPEVALPSGTKALLPDRAEFRDDKTIRTLGVKYQQHSGRMRGTEYQILLPMSGQIIAESYTERPKVPEPVELLDLGVLQWKPPVKPKTVRLDGVLADVMGELVASDGNDPVSVNIAQKGKVACRIESKLAGLFPYSVDIWQDDGYRPFLLIVGEGQGVKLELLAKGLFRYIARVDTQLSKVGKSKRMLLALYFSDEVQLQEFIRIYSIFYSADGQNNFMKGVQLALCLKGRGSEVPEVVTILMGTDIASAKRNAEIFTYHHTGTSAYVLPILNYLTRSESARVRKKDSSLAMFPFDLYLQENPSISTPARSEAENELRLSPKADCWFLRKVAQSIQRNLREEDYGCKISDIHVRLGSKMHVETFFEAELLFQNIGNIVRFAFLIVRQLRLNFDLSRKDILLVAYEDYSSILVSYVAKYISRIQAGKGTVDYAIYTNQPEGQLCPSDRFQAYPRKKQLEFLCNAEIVTLLPVGATLSTIYAMRESVWELQTSLRHMVDQSESGETRYHHTGGNNNIVMVLVADTKAPDLVQQYWKHSIERDEQSDNGIIDICSPGGGISARAYYFLQTHANWHDHMACVDDDEHSRVLVYVDTTSTVPNIIFPLWGTEPKGISAFLPRKSASDMDERAQKRQTVTALDSRKRIELLRNCIIYGHIRSGANHLLYDIDISKYCTQVEQTRGEIKGLTTISQWLVKLRNETSFIQPEAFNIIVSPLDMDNAPFLRLVVEHLFSHSIRFLRIPIQDARTDDIRAKFSFITQECRELSKRNIPVNVYYVDNSIVTGGTFRRGQKLIQILLQDAMVPQTDTGVFRGVLLLVNRSRIDTAASMVKEPKVFYQAYLHLAIPHYNTVHGECPGCSFHRRNLRMAESCATNFLVGEFQRLSEKYQLYTRQEYLKEKRNALRHSSGAFQQLCQWLYRTPERNLGDPSIGKAYELVCGLRRSAIQDFLAKMNVACPEKEELKCLAQYLAEGGAEENDRSTEESRKDAYLCEMASLKLRDFPIDRNDELVLEDIWLNKVLDEKAMLRTYCTHLAYTQLENEDNVNENGKISASRIKECLYWLLEGCNGDNLLELLSGGYLDEVIISFLKILSREYLAKYYDVREQIAELMVGLVKALLGMETEERDYRILDGSSSEEKRKNYPLLRYNLLVTLYQQLANLQINVILRGDILAQVVHKIRELEEEYFSSMVADEDQFLLCPVMPESEQHIQFTRCLKWLSLSNDEENNCFLIQRELPLPEEGK